MLGYTIENVPDEFKYIFENYIYIQRVKGDNGAGYQKCRIIKFILRPDKNNYNATLHLKDLSTNQKSLYTEANIIDQKIILKEDYMFLDLISFFVEMSSAKTFRAKTLRERKQFQIELAAQKFKNPEYFL